MSGIISSLTITCQTRLKWENGHSRPHVILQNTFDEELDIRTATNTTIFM